MLKQSDPPALNGLSEMYEITKKYHWKKEFENLLKFISSIESDLRLSFDEDSSIFTNFPHQFSLITVINIRIAKILRSLSLVNFIYTLIQIYAYSHDIFQFVVEKKFGFSLIPFFNSLSKIKKYLNTINSIFRISKP